MIKLITQKPHLFKFDNNNYVYIPSSNNVYYVSDEGVEFIKNGKEDSSIKKEMYSILTNKVTASNQTKHSIHIKLSETDKIDFDYLVNQLTTDSSYIEKNLFLELEGSKKHIEEILELNKKVRVKNYNLVLKDDIANLYSKEDLKVFKEHKIGVSYYTTLDTLKKIIEEQANVKGVVELRLNNIEEAKEVFKKMKIPLNLGLVFSTKDSKTSKYILSEFSNIIVKLIKTKTKTRCLNLSTLFKLNIGKSIPENDYNYISDDETVIKSKDCSKCNACWTKQNCWNSKIYTVFSSHPYLTSLNTENCNLIRELNEEVIKAYLLVKEKNKPKKPIKIHFKKFTLKFLNP